MIGFKRSLIQSFIVITGGAMSVILSGCQIDLSSYSGNYAGQITVTHSEQMTRENANIHVLADQPDHLNLQIQSRTKNWAWEIQPAGEFSELKLVTSGELEFEGHLHKQSDSNCFETSSIHLTKYAQICFDDSQVTVEVEQHDTKISLRLDRASIQPNAEGLPNLPPLEKPAAYTSAELRDHGRQRSFSTRMEFEENGERKVERSIKVSQSHSSPFNQLRIGNCHVFRGIWTDQFNW